MAFLYCGTAFAQNASSTFPVFWVAGDPQQVANAFQGLAAFFGNGNSSSAVMTGGLLAGSLAGLIVALFSSATRQQFMLGPWFVSTVVTMAMFSSQTTITVKPFFSDNGTTVTPQTIVVNHVPIGVAYPAGIASEMTKAVSDVYLQWFTEPGDGGVSVQGTAGLLSPLKMLLKLQEVYDCSQSNTTICNNLVAYMKYCPVQTLASQSMQSNTGISDVLNNSPGGTPNGQLQGTTQFYQVTTDSSGNQTITSTAVPCSQAGPQIYQAMATYIDSDSFTSDVLARSSSAEPDGPSTVAAADTMLNTLSQNIAATAQSANATMTGNGQQRDATMMNLVFSPIFRAAQQASLDQSQAAYTFTTLMGNARNKAMIDTAGEASLFESFMTNAMNAFSFLFVALTPIVVIVAITMGVGGFKIYAAWFLMGIWSQGWLPVATVLSYYVQTSFWSRLLAFASSPTMSPASIDNFYTQVSSTIYAGSTMIGATPIITLSLLTGSVYTLTSLAGRATGTGRDYMDTDRNDGNAYNLANADAARQQVTSQGLEFASQNGAGVQAMTSAFAHGATANAGAIVRGDVTTAATIEFGQGLSNTFRAGQSAQLSAETAHQRVQSLTDQLQNLTAQRHSTGLDVTAGGDHSHMTGAAKDNTTSQDKRLADATREQTSHGNSASVSGSFALKVPGTQIGGGAGVEATTGQGTSNEQTGAKTTGQSNQDKVSTDDRYSNIDGVRVTNSDSLDSQISHTRTALAQAQEAEKEALQRNQQFAHDAQSAMQSGAKTSVNVADLATMAYQTSDPSRIGDAVRSAVYSDAVQTAQGLARSGQIADNAESIVNKAQEITNQTLAGADFSKANNLSAMLSRGVLSSDSGVHTAAQAGVAALASQAGRSGLAESILEKSNLDRFISQTESSPTNSALAGVASGTSRLDASPLNPASGPLGAPAGGGAGWLGGGAGGGGGGFGSGGALTPGSAPPLSQEIANAANQMHLPAGARDRAIAEAGQIEHGQKQDQDNLDKRTQRTEHYDPKADVTLLDPKTESRELGLPPPAPSPAAHATRDATNLYDRPLHPPRKS
ncbi:conjugal transfer protein TraG N-terminal domain-containing protein [Paraburkholderia fungorum]|uniref:conjugal transfer protein TraG N-terminal domain-containing protein n=1 Tax=Paraburkholderia fungorum TaxID=134537 RepID=UPI00142D6587|nr:conjugal transfer protein TraG N-terminal domain-containing protein [Paraburkholderia fungorum]